jgi:hypothetical protein
MRVWRLLLGLGCACGAVNHDMAIDAPGSDASGPDAQTCVPTPANLAARWSGEHNTNDDKGLFNGTAHGQLAYTQGRFGSAFMLDGTTAYITADNSDVLWPTGSFSIAAWVKAASITATSYVLVKYGGGGSTATDGNDYELGVNMSGNPVFNFRVNGSPTGSITLTATTVDVVDARWHYLVAARDNAAMELRLYIDGVRTVSKAIAGADLGAMGNVDNAPDPVTISGYFRPGMDAIAGMFAGAIDNVEYFTAALSDGEITAIYAALDGECQ